MESMTDRLVADAEALHRESVALLGRPRTAPVRLRRLPALGRVDFCASASGCVHHPGTVA